MALRNKLPGVLFYTSFAFVLYFVFKSYIHTELVYHLQQPVFTGTIESAFSSLVEFRGTLNYLGDLFIELCYFPNVGAAILALLITVLTIITFPVWRSKQKLSITDFVLMLLVTLITVSIISYYQFELPFILSLFISFLIARGSIKIICQTTGNEFVKLVVVTIIYSVAFVLLGGAGFLLAITVAILGLLPFKQNRNMLIVALGLLLILAAVVPIIAGLIWLKTVPVPYLYFSELVGNTYSISSVTTQYRLLFLLLILIQLNRDYRFSFLTVNKQKVVYGLGFISIVILAIVPNFITSSDRREMLEVDKLASNGEWEQILSIYPAEKATNNRTSMFYVNRALSETSGLLDNAFKYPQQFGDEGLYLNTELNRNILLPTSDLYYQLGFINESRHYAHEAFSVLETNARIYRRLVEVNIIFGNYIGASKYTMNLRNSWVHGAWARSQEQLLKSPDKIQDDSIYAKKIEYLPVDDFFSVSSNVWANLENLNKQNKCNKAAFEYLVCSYLLNHNIAKVLSVVPQFRNYGYTELPAPVQEAVLVYVASTGNNVLELGGYKLSETVKKGFVSYSKEYMAYQSGKVTQDEIASKFGSTYCYFIHFVSPKSKKK